MRPSPQPPRKSEVVGTVAADGVTKPMPMPWRVPETTISTTPSVIWTSDCITLSEECTINLYRSSSSLHVAGESESCLSTADCRRRPMVSSWISCCSRKVFCCARMVFCSAMSRSTWMLGSCTSTEVES